MAKGARRQRRAFDAAIERMLEPDERVLASVSAAYTSPVVQVGFVVGAILVLISLFARLPVLALAASACFFGTGAISHMGGLAVTNRRVVCTRVRMLFPEDVARIVWMLPRAQVTVVRGGRGSIVLSTPRGRQRLFVGLLNSGDIERVAQALEVAPPSPTP